MKRSYLVLFLLFGSAADPVLAAPPCDQCKDLPFLFRELMQQEFLRDQFESYVKQSYYPPTVEQMYATVEKRFNSTFYGPPSAGSGAAGAAPAQGGGAAFGTRSWLKACDLVEFLKGPDGKPLLDKDGNPRVKPVTPQQVRAKECKAIADHVLDHEGHHQESCRETHRTGKADSWQSAEFVARDEVEAYQEGIASLRETIAKLARECNWDGSVRSKKPDGTSVVPTREQIEQLKDNTRKIGKSLGENQAMNSLLAALTLSLVVFGEPRIDAPLDELLARYEADCPGAADCGPIRDELELRLYHDLRQLYRTGDEVDRETLHAAAAARFPYLALLALSWMQQKPLDGDEGAIIAALDSPSPAVRSAALALLGDRLPPSVAALGDWLLNNGYARDDSLVPEAEPDADLLGFDPYPGARLVRLASGSTRAFYTTSDSPDRVLAAIGKGKQVLGSLEFYQRVSEAMVMPDYEALQVEMEKMLTETDPEKQAAMQAELAEAMQPQSLEMHLLEGLGPVMSRGDARVVILREQPSPTPDGAPYATRVAAVFHDPALAATVILVPLE